MQTLTPCLHPGGYLILLRLGNAGFREESKIFILIEGGRMGQVMSLLRLVGGIRQPQCTLVIILHLHPLLLNTKGGQSIS